jgi:uncharacterized protein YxeA
MKKNLIYIIGILVLAVITFFVIRHFMNKESLDVDVSKINISVKLERFDLELRKEDKTYADIENLYEKYGEFFEVYNYEIIGIGGIENSSYLTYLNTFLNDYAVIEASDEVEIDFDNCDVLNTELTDGFKHLKYY